jgi:hypothetical protein
MLNRIRNILSHPGMTAVNLRVRVDRSGLFRRYARMSRSAGLRRLYLVLSLDCDSPEDTDCAAAVCARLASLGVTPVLAVTGELLEQGADTYRAISGSGAEFMNHGFRMHTYRDEQAGAYRSCFFYDQLSPDQVRDDIRRGHDVVQYVLGVAPCGFRAPHFGTFQKQSQLSALHGFLKELGYTHSSSTMPYFGLKHGAAFRAGGGIVEFPVSGMWSRPLAVLDTWSCFEAPERALSSADYGREGRAVAQHFERAGIVGILNYYADPSHIADQEIFYETVSEWARMAEPSTYTSLLEVMKP